MLLLQKNFFFCLAAKIVPSAFSWGLLVPWNTVCISNMPDLCQGQRGGKEMKRKCLSLLPKYSCSSRQVIHYSTGTISFNRQTNTCSDGAQVIELELSPWTQNFRHWYRTKSWSVWLLIGKANSSGNSSSKSKEDRLSGNQKVSSCCAACRFFQLWASATANWLPWGKPGCTTRSSLKTSLALMKRWTRLVRPLPIHTRP